VSQNVDISFEDHHQHSESAKAHYRRRREIGDLTA
jgi:hypothetical protein